MPTTAAELEPKKRKLELSASQVVGGALAAMTAAALGSTLGVAGTIIGAALASVVAGVAGALYTASLRTGRERVMTVFGGRTSTSRTGSTALPPPPPQLPGPRGRFPWRRALAITVAVFALAAVLVSAYEVVTGHALSGGSGTTVSQVGRGSSGSSPAPAKPSSSASGAASASSTSASTPSPSATQPSQSAEPSGSPASPATASGTPAPPAAAASPGLAGTPAG
jgi:hypothetical protein